MCLFQKAPAPPRIDPAPQKTDYAIQQQSEADRIRNGYSRGITSTILTAGLGDVTVPTTNTGVKIGGF